MRINHPTTTIDSIVDEENGASTLDDELVTDLPPAEGAQEHAIDEDTLPLSVTARLYNRPETNTPPTFRWGPMSLSKRRTFEHAIPDPLKNAVEGKLRAEWIEDDAPDGLIAEIDFLTHTYTITEIETRDCDRNRDATSDS